MIAGGSYVTGFPLATDKAPEASKCDPSSIVQMNLMRDKDKRTKLMNEILGGIKVLKLYAWEKSFMQRITDLRSKELAALRAQAWLSGFMVFAFTSAPFLVALASFAVFVLSDPNNVLDANKAFVSL